MNIQISPSSVMDTRNTIVEDWIRRLNSVIFH